MTSLDSVRKHWQLFLEGKGFAGKVEEFQPPNLQLILEDFKGGGMDGTIRVDMGQEPMEATWKMTTIEAEALKRWGFGLGVTYPLVCRGSLENQTTGEAVPEVFTCRGKISQIEWDAVVAGGKSGVSFTMQVHMFEYNQKGAEIMYIDVPNMIRRVNGVDILAAHRANIGS